MKYFSSYHVVTMQSPSWRISELFQHMCIISIVQSHPYQGIRFRHFQPGKLSNYRCSHLGRSYSDISARKTVRLKFLTWGTFQIMRAEGLGWQLHAPRGEGLRKLGSRYHTSGAVDYYTVRTEHQPAQSHHQGHDLCLCLGPHTPKWGPYPAQIVPPSSHNAPTAPQPPTSQASQMAAPWHII